MFHDIRGSLGCLYKAAEVIAMLDMISSCVLPSLIPRAIRADAADAGARRFAEVSSKNEYGASSPVSLY